MDMKTDRNIVSVRNAEWCDCRPRSRVTKLVRDDGVGVNLFVLGPGEPMASEFREEWLA